MAREMKNSGVKWIGEIPRGWKLVKVKYVSNIASGTTPASNIEDYWDGEIRWITPADFKTSEKWIKTGRRNITEKGRQASHLTIFPTSSVIFSKRAPIGQVGITTEKLCINQGCLGCITNEIISPTILYYLLSVFTEQFELLGSGTTFKEISATKFASFSIPLPPFSEQKTIADFLDKKCAEIDGLLADLEAEVKTLAEYKKSIIAETVTRGLNPNAPMKQSGIPWAETIPAHWDIQKGKYTFRLLQRPVKEDDGVITCFRDGEVTLRSNRREDGFTMSAKEYGYQGIEPGDLVVHGMDGFAGSIGISDSRGKGTPVLNVLDSKYNKRYLMYYLRNMAYGDVFLALSTGIRVRSCDLGWKKLGEIRIVLPPIEEQEKIADYIDHKLDEIQNAIVNKTQQIETLKAYKSSLIYEYVTGKKQVI